MIRPFAAFLLAGALALSACSPPMSAALGFEDEIAAGLGAGEQPLVSGLYRIAGFHEPGGAVKSYADMLAEAEKADPPEPVPLPEFFVLQWQPGARSYALFMQAVRITRGAGEAQVLTVSNGDETLFLPVEVSADGRSASVYVYACIDLPEDFRAAQAIESDCAVTSSETVRAGIAHLDPSDMARIDIAFVSPLPDLGG